MTVPARQKLAASHWILGCSLLAVGIAMLWCLPSDVWAAFDTSNIDAKFKELTEAAKKVAWGILGIGAVVIGIKLNNGDPDTKQRAWQFLFAGIVVYMAADIVTWLQN